MKNGCWIPSKHPFFRVKPRFFPFPENRRIFHFLARPKAVSPLQISSSKALSSFVQERQTPCKYGVLAISTHSLSSSPNPTYPSPKTVYLRPFPSIPVYEIFGGCVQLQNGNCGVSGFASLFFYALRRHVWASSAIASGADDRQHRRVVGNAEAIPDACAGK